MSSAIAHEVLPNHLEFGFGEVAPRKTKFPTKAREDVVSQALIVWEAERSEQPWRLDGLTSGQQLGCTSDITPDQRVRI